MDDAGCRSAVQAARRGFGVPRNLGGEASTAREFYDGAWALVGGVWKRSLEVDVVHTSRMSSKEASILSLI